jgi:hypothetical protein
MLPSYMGKSVSYYSKPSLIGSNVGMRRPFRLVKHNVVIKKKINDISSADEKKITVFKNYKKRGNGYSSIEDS